MSYTDSIFMPNGWALQKNIFREQSAYLIYCLITGQDIPSYAFFGQPSKNWIPKMIEWQKNRGYPVYELSSPKKFSVKRRAYFNSVDEFKNQEVYLYNFDVSHHLKEEMQYAMVE